MRLAGARHGQRGEAIFLLMVLAAFVLEGIVFVTAAGFRFLQIGIADRMQMERCLGVVQRSSASLQRRFGATGDVPPDDPDAIAIKECKVRLDAIMSGVQLVGNSPAVADSLRTAINAALQDLATCRVQSVSPGNATAGITRAFTVEAAVPLGGGQAAATVHVTAGEAQFSAALPPSDRPTRSATVAIPEDVSRNAGATVSKVTVTSQSTVGQAINGRCPGLITPTPSGECLVSCTSPPVDVVWRDPPIPQIALFRAIPATIVTGRLEPLFLVWNVKDAVSVEIDQGIGEIDRSGSWFELPPDVDTTYTLTARGVLPGDTRTATAQVTLQAPPTITLASPANNSSVTDASVLVSGTVSSVPPGATAAISVNGGAAVPAAIDAAGNFAATVPLDKRITLFDLTLSNPNVGVNSCGPRAQAVVVLSQKTLADVTNTITVTVTGVTPPVTASTTVFHAVLVTGFRVTWNTCPPLNKDESPDIVLSGGGFVQVGTVDCGVTGSGGFMATCSVTVSVDTTVGGFDADATWTFDVASCP